MASTLCCEVSLNTDYCEFPANLDPEDGEAIRTRCWSCGQRACKTCSVVQRWAAAPGPRTRVRICNDCVGDYQMDNIPGAQSA